MITFDRIKAEFDRVIQEFDQSRGVSRLLGGGITANHYASLLRQIFHHTRENPQIQALATVYFRGRRRSSIKLFYKHATSEIGHDQLALDDMRALGHEVDSVPLENPLPSTTALLSFPYFQIYNLNPVGYLGYLFFLEFMPTSSGHAYIRALERIGVPRSAMTFLRDHTTIDLGHNKLMGEYISGLILDELDYASTIYAMRVAGRLYANMVQEAFEQADRYVEWGASAEEDVPRSLIG